MGDRDSEEEARVRYLRRAMGEADRLSEELDLPREVRETATRLYRELRDQGLLPGRAVEEVIAAAIYLGCKMDDIPRTPDEIADHSDYQRIAILRTSKYLIEALKLEVPPSNPDPYVKRFCEELNLSEKSEHIASNIANTAVTEGLVGGKAPSGIAAGSVYAATQFTDDKVTQEDISTVADVSKVTIRNRYKELLEVYGESD